MGQLGLLRRISTTIMMIPTFRQLSLVAAACLITSSVPVARAQSDPAALSARESHDGLTISVDPYLEAARYKDRFGNKKTPYDAGIIAIEIFFRNDNDMPIRVGIEGIRLTLKPEGHDRQRLQPLTPEDVADQVWNPGTANPTAPRTPIPGRGKKPARGKDWQQLQAALRAVMLSGDLVPPHGTLHGFLYFDLDSHFEWISTGGVYFPDLKVFPEMKPLFYFEVSLATSHPR
jgi:hypothetical protein